MIRTLLLVGLGGFLGSILRYLLDQVFHRIFQTTFPIGTMFVNILGCFLLGIIYAFIEREQLISDELRIFLTIGFCGGFTTYSTFAFDQLHLLKSTDFLQFAFYFGGSVCLGLLAVYLGMQIYKVF